MDKDERKAEIGIMSDTPPRDLSVHIGGETLGHLSEMIKAYGLLILDNALENVDDAALEELENMRERFARLSALMVRFEKHIRTSQKTALATRVLMDRLETKGEA